MGFDIKREIKLDSLRRDTWKPGYLTCLVTSKLLKSLLRCVDIALEEIAFSEWIVKLLLKKSMA